MKTIASIFLLLLLQSGADSTISLDAAKSSLQVFGTSSIHDWESTVKDFSIKGKLQDETITGLVVQVKGESLESGKSIMDDKTYDALKTDDHPVIEFKADKLTISGQEVNGKGTLSLAGKAREVAMNAKVISQSAGKIQLRGAVELKMSDFGITPPTAMFGSLKTGDEVVVKYEIFLNKNNN